MSERSDEHQPRTAGELRRRLAELGNPWTVDPRLSDDDPLPEYARGGQPEEEVPEHAQLSAMAPDVDLQELLSSEPPTNPFLRALWAERGLIARDDAPGFAQPARDDDDPEAAA